MIIDGTTYKDNTAPDVVTILERARRNHERIRVFYGDTKTGKAWPEENDVSGYVGRSWGPMKIPLLIAPNASGGHGILDHCIVAIVTSRSHGYRGTKPRFEYKHPAFDNGRWSVSTDGTVKHNGDTYARCKSWKSALRLCAFMRGERMAK